MHQRADRYARQDIDRGDNNGGDGVALDELHCAVHCTVQLAFLFQVHTARTGFIHRDYASAQIRIDTHLLTGHRVQRESGTDFRHSLGALRDHHKLHDRDNQEHHAADDDVAADHQIAEGVDDLAGIRVQQNLFGRGNVQRQPK